MPKLQRATFSGGMTSETMAHAPAVHACPAGQARAHIPQFAASVWSVTQAAPHRVCPLGHIGSVSLRHTPPSHTCPLAQGTIIDDIPSAAQTRRVRESKQSVAPGVHAVETQT